MAQADSNDTTTAPYGVPLREYLFEGAAIIAILLSAGITSCLIAANLEDKIGAHCAADLQRAVQ
jgi:hypothetical protein